MILQIRFQNFEKPENERYIAAIVEKYRALLPTWLRTLTVSITDTLSESGSLLWAIGKPEYGTANIVIVSRWLDRDPELQRLDLLHEILHVAHRREYSFVQSQLLDPIEDQDKKLHGYLVEDYRVRNEEFIEGLAQGIRALLGETEKEASMSVSGPMKCAQCHESPGFIAWWSCPKCGDYCCGDKCAIAHTENCQKPPAGYTCKLCGSIFQELGDFTKHATTCVRPSEIPKDLSFHCPKCGLSFVSTSEVMRHTQSCQGVPPVPDQKRVPDEAKPMVAGYLELSELVFKHCPNNPERIHALRTLHESMQTAISSIVCADAWQTPKGD